MPAARTARSARPTSRSHGPRWTRWPDERLLDLRLCDLGVSLQSPFLKSCIRQILDELDQRGIRFRPHFWISSEWFTPAGVPGCAVPFYLAHPRLIQLERRQMLDVEGGTHKACLKILRHEVGHALDHAYLLHRRRRWRQLFGKSSRPYPEFYQPWPFSRRYVLHLDYWYAQAHPDEDFAETFAVWLRPRSGWRKRYRGWPAMEKLEYVDRLMAEIADAKPRVAARTVHEPLHRIRKTLRQYYADKRKTYEKDYPGFYDHDLRRLFSAAPEHARHASAAAFLRRIRRDVRRRVARWTGEYQYTLDLVLADMINRCRELNLRVAGSTRRLKTEICILLTVQTMNYLHTGRHRVAM